MFEDAVITGVRIVLGGTFVAAAAAKALTLTRFHASLVGYGLSLPVARSLAVPLLAAELLIGVALIIGVLSPIAEVSALSALVVFTAAVSYRWARTGSFDCGCFGSGSATHAWLVFPRNGVLLLATVALLRHGLDPSPAATIGGWIFAVTCGLAIALSGMTLNLTAQTRS